MSLKLLHHLKVTTLCFGHIVFAFSKCLSTLFILLLPSEIFHGTFVFYCLLTVSCVIKLVMVIFQKLCIIESTGVSSFDILTSVTFLASLLECVLDKSLGRNILPPFSVCYISTALIYHISGSLFGLSSFRHVP